MKRPRFNGRRPQALRLAPAVDKHSQWNQLAGWESLSRDINRSHRRQFAVVSGPIGLTPNGQPIRQILIFDNSPATLRLLNRGGWEVINHTRRSDRYHVAVAGLLVFALMLAMFWPLFAAGTAAKSVNAASPIQYRTAQ